MKRLIFFILVLLSMKAGSQNTSSDNTLLKSDTALNSDSSISCKDLSCSSNIGSTSFNFGCSYYIFTLDKNRRFSFPFVIGTNLIFKDNLNNSKNLVSYKLYNLKLGLECLYRLHKKFYLSFGLRALGCKEIYETETKSNSYSQFGFYNSNGIGGYYSNYTPFTTHIEKSYGNNFTYGWESQQGIKFITKGKVGLMFGLGAFEKYVSSEFYDMELGFFAEIGLVFY